MIDQASIHIEILDISDWILNKFGESYRDELKKLDINELNLKLEDNQILNETFEILNEMKLCTLSIIEVNHSFSVLKICLSLTLTNIRLVFDAQFAEMLKVTFINSPILLFDSYSNIKLNFICKSVNFEINNEGFKTIVLLKSDDKSLQSCDCLFVPLESVNELELFNFKIESNLFNLSNQLENYENKCQVKNIGFVVPLSHLAKTCYYNKGKLVNPLISNLTTANEIFKANHTVIEMAYLDDLLEIEELFPDCFDNFNYLFNNFNKSIQRNEEVNIMSNMNLMKHRISKIEIYHPLSSKEIEIVLMLLCSRRTRFSLSNINLRFNKLSECFTALILCTDCPELEIIDFKYFQSDIESEEEAIECAIWDFKQKFGFIKSLKIIKYLR